jgi:hypothetical protein
VSRSRVVGKKHHGQVFDGPRTAHVEEPPRGLDGVVFAFS